METGPEKPGPHTWTQVRSVLWALGYTEAKVEEGLMFFRMGEKFVVIQKSNRLGPAYVLAVCNQVGISYKDFQAIWAKESARIRR